MATFSLGSGVTPGAPGVYINEQAGRAANAALADFSTVYMLVETEDTVPVTRFPFNLPIPVTSLADYRALLGGVIPEERIPLLSYNCVNEFFQNAQVGDLRVVRVGTPNQIVEIEFFPSGSKTNATDLPSALQAGDLVYVQMVINGLRLVAGDGSTGYTSQGEWLGVPVTIPVDYVAGDAPNNRRITRAIADAVAGAIESNPSVRSSVYVRDFGVMTDLDPLSLSENGFVSIAATTFDANVSVVTQVIPVGSNFVFMQNTYDVENIVGGGGQLERVPQDYTQCIATAFDGQQDKGYLVTPTAYAQFDAAGRALVGAAAANHCASNSYKWMALADPGPFLVTDINKYESYVPHQPCADLVTGLRYLVDNAIYEWVGVDVNYPRLSYQELVKGGNPETSITESAQSVADGVKVGLLDPAIYTLSSTAGSADDGKFLVSSDAYWPVDLTIQEVTVSGADAVGNDFRTVNVTGSAGTVNLEGQQVYLVAAPYDVEVTGPYPLQEVYLALTAAAASALLTEVTAAGGTSKMTAVPTTLDVVYVAAPSSDTCNVTYTAPYWNLPVTVNGQTSNLIQNISGATAGVNTNHLPATLQSPTNTYRLSFTSRTMLNPGSGAVGGLLNTGTGVYAGAIVFSAVGHGLVNGQKLYFTNSITNGATTLVKATSKLAVNPYYVKVIDNDNFVLASSLTAYTGSSFLLFPSSGTISTKPTIFYTNVLGGNQTAVSLAELTTVPFVRARKYDFAAGTIFNEAASTAAAPAPSTSAPAVSIWLNNSAQVLGETLVSPWGEDKTASSLCGWLPKLKLATPGSPVTTVDNAYCVPTVDQNFASEAFMVPSIDPIFGGSYDPTGAGALSASTAYANAAGLADGDAAATIQGLISGLAGVYFDVTANGSAPDGATAVVSGDRIAVVFNGSTYTWAVVAAASLGGDLTSVGQVCYQSQVEMVYTAEQTPPSSLWRFDAITSTEIIDSALRGVGFNGVPQAVFIEAGVDNVNRLFDDSQRYFNPFGFIAYYGPYIENGAGQFIPPSSYVTGVALRRYRAEGYQFPPAGVKYQLADAVSTQIPVNSAQQNLLNPDGCNVVRSLPGYPQTAVFIWGGRTRVNSADAQQRLYQFVNTRVILNVVYGSLRSAFDSQIFNVIDGFGVVYNQIVSVGNSVLNQLYVRGALFGARPSDAFQVICDSRINSSESLENGIVNAKVFVTPVPTLERIQIDLIRVAIGKMQEELDIQGLGS